MSAWLKASALVGAIFVVTGVIIVLGILGSYYPWIALPVLGALMFATLVAGTRYVVWGDD